MIPNCPHEIQKEDTECLACLFERVGEKRFELIKKLTEDTIFRRSSWSSFDRRKGKKGVKKNKVGIVRDDRTKVEWRIYLRLITGEYDFICTVVASSGPNAIDEARKLYPEVIVYGTNTYSAQGPNGGMYSRKKNKPGP